MRGKTYTARTLEGAWHKTLKTILKDGIEIFEDDPLIELQNLEVSYQNAFETKCPNYQQVFGNDFLDYIHRVYSPSGDQKTGRNYHKLIYNDNKNDQVENAIDLLKKDPNSRSAIIVLSSPDIPKKPCVTEVSFSIRQNVLNMTAIFKSSDFAKKFIPDMIELSEIHKKISRSLNVSRGDVNAFILCAQIYKGDLDKVTLTLNNFKKKHYFKTDAVIDNWDKEAANWDKYIRDPNHYVNIENGYSRFLDFLNDEILSVKDGSLKNALDSGSGTGVIANVLRKKGYNVKGIDISPQMLAYSYKKDKNIQYILSNNLDIPYPDNSFDLVCSRGVLISHVGKKYVNLFLEEHSRVLKKGGLFMFDFITKFNKSETKKKRNKAYLSFGKMSDLLESNGFKVIKRSGEDNNRVNAILCKKV